MPLLTKIIMDVSLIHLGISSSVLILLSLKLANDERSPIGRKPDLQRTRIRGIWQQKHFFSCIAVLVRDIVGQPLERAKKENKFPRKQKPTKQTHQPNKTPPQNQTRQRSREICKQGETGETSASLSSPSQVLFRQVVLPHVVHV